MLINHHQTIPTNYIPRKSNNTYYYKQSPTINMHFFSRQPILFFEERHAQLSAPLERVNRQAFLSEPTYNLYPPCKKTSIESDTLAKIKILLKYIDKLYIREEIEIFKPPEFILIYPNHQHQLPQSFRTVHHQKIPHFFYTIAPQIFPQTT